MKAEDLKVRQKLLDTGKLGGGYVPEMEAVHLKNAQRLKKSIAVHDWQDEGMAGPDGAQAACFVVQHAIGDPQFQQECLVILRISAEQMRIPRWHVVYLEVRIAMQEGR